LLKKGRKDETEKEIEKSKSEEKNKTGKKIEK